jgi:hypothetical protein
MRKMYVILAIVFFTATVQAQYIYNDFDANQNEELSGWPNVPTAIANPDASGINTSANVGEWVRSEEQWAHVFIELDGMIDFSTGEVFHLKVWSPIACDFLFKLEDKSNGAVFIETTQTVTEVNQWVELAFDFTGAGSGLYDKIVVFMDFSTTTDNTFYFDDLEGPEYGGGVTPGDPLTLPVTFDDDELDYGLIDFGGNASEIVVDPTNAENKVAKSIKTEAAELWAGTTVGGNGGFAAPFPFTEDETSMTVDVWSPTSGTPIRLKVEDAGDPTISVETETLTTVAEAWETLTFDFSNEAPGTAELNLAYNYNKASIFFNFGTEGSVTGEQTYYWDNIEFDGEGPVVKPLAASDVQENFEDDGYSTIPAWTFQDPDLVDMQVIVDPMNAENHAGDYVRSGNFEWTNAQFILDHRMDLTVRNIFMLKVYFPSSNDYTGDLTPTAALKLQNSLLGGEAWTTQTEILLTIDEFDTWVNLEFDFGEVADREDYDQIVVQFGGEGHFVPGQFHFDDLVLMDPSSIFSQPMNQFSIYPNPVEDEFVMEIGKELSSLTIYNMQGQTVVSKTGHVTTLNVSQLAGGVYQVIAETATGTLYTAKMLKK